MTDHALVGNYKRRTSTVWGPSSAYVTRPPASYRALQRELQFAIQAGDETFAPAAKLLLDEAAALAHRSHYLPLQTYQMYLLAIKEAFQSLFELETLHPVGKRLQWRYRQTYRDSFWHFLEAEKLIARPIEPERFICSDGNIDKCKYFRLKRVLDFVLASLALVVLAPLLLLIAVLIKLDSPGPVFFVQERVGSRKRERSGLSTWEIRTFKFYKFRSMYQNADQSLHKNYIESWIHGRAEDSGDKKARFKLNGDPRVTPIGGKLRKTSLDELPQLFNVLKGEMSLVGPRPVPIYEVNFYEAQHYERLAALPGMTGLWQVKGRGYVTFEEQIKLDIEYIYNQSLWFDLKLMLLTIPAVLTSRGAK